MTVVKASHEPGIGDSHSVGSGDDCTDCFPLSLFLSSRDLQDLYGHSPALFLIPPTSHDGLPPPKFWKNMHLAIVFTCCCWRQRVLHLSSVVMLGRSFPLVHSIRPHVQPHVSLPLGHAHCNVLPTPLALPGYLVRMLPASMTSMRLL